MSSHLLRKPSGSGFSFACVFFLAMSYVNSHNYKKHNQIIETFPLPSLPSIPSKRRTGNKNLLQNLTQQPKSLQQIPHIHIPQKPKIQDHNLLNALQLATSTSSPPSITLTALTIFFSNAVSESPPFGKEVRSSFIMVV